MSKSESGSPLKQNKFSLQILRFNSQQPYRKISIHIHWPPALRADGHVLHLGVGGRSSLTWGGDFFRNCDIHLS